MTTEEAVALDAVKQIGINANLDTLKAAEGLVKSLIELFNDSIGVQGHHNNNGADYLYCESCGRSQNVVGDASMSAHINSMEHDESCKLVKLYGLVQSLSVVQSS